MRWNSSPSPNASLGPIIEIVGGRGERPLSSTTDPHDTVLVAGYPAPFSVRRSQRARRAAVHIHPRRGIEVVLPDGSPDTDVPALLREKAAWLDHHAIDVHRARVRPPLQPGATLPYRGRWLRLRLVASNRPPITADLTAVTLDLCLPRPQNPTAVRLALLPWYRRRAREHLLASLRTLRDPADGPVRRLTVRNQDTCWGSCSSGGGLSFNWRLVMAPPPVLDAVVAHELVHLRHLDHSSAFWSLLDARFPRHRACRRWLDANAYRLDL